MKTRLAIVSIAALLALTGCASSAGGSSEEHSSTSQQERTSDEPSDAGSSSAADPGAPALSEADRIFLDYVRSELLPSTGIADASDADLIAAGHAGCDQVKAGVPLEQIRLVEGEEPTASGYYMDTSAIFSGAQLAYCPETVPELD